MSENNPNNQPFLAKKKLTIADLYPDLTAQEQAEAEYSLKCYFNLVWRIFERVNRENPELLTKELEKARLNEISESD